VIRWRGMSLHEIVLRATKPETEWVRGRARQKVSPTYSHAVLQRLFATALGDWADLGGHGRVGTEWRFRVQPPGEIVRPLVPDVAFLSYAAIPANAAAERVELPLAAPTVAVEILSPDDRAIDVNDKIAVYLRAGSALVIVVDPRSESIALHSAITRHVRPGERLEDPALPGFTLDVAALFARAKGRSIADAP
ncbi:MAG: Uma2 family endonuclease, partial [Vulcanimicrobiaceae bacterium]